MNRKKLLFIILAILCIGITIWFGINFCHPKDETPIPQKTQSKKEYTLDQKLSLLENNVLKNDSLLQPSIDRKIIILSASDGKNPAIIRHGEAESFNEAFKLAKTELLKAIPSSSNNSIKWLKVDAVNFIESTTFESFENELKATTQGYYRKGIIIKAQDHDIFLLESELNQNRLLNYAQDGFNIKKLNNYLTTIGEAELEQIPDSFEVFTTVSSFCDEKNKVYEIESNDVNYGRRKMSVPSKETVKSIIDNTNNFLTSQMTEHGSFVYGYFASENSTLNDYNLVRHAGTVWGMITCYDKKASNHKEHKEAIEKGLDYLKSNIIVSSSKPQHIAFHGNQACLGLDGLALAAFCEYTSTFKDNHYLEECKALGEAILSFQDEQGRFNHIISLSTGEVIEEFSIQYYDGEAILALCKLYEITKDEKYLQAAQKGLDYCIDHDYLKYADHWLEYCVNEITKYVSNQKYYAFGLENITTGLSQMQLRRTTSHTDLERLIQGFEIYQKLKENNLYPELLAEFPETEFLNLLKQRVDLQLNSYSFPEISMYFSNPSQFTDLFVVRNDGFRVRIDDEQHSMMGFWYYLKNYDKINN